MHNETKKNIIKKQNESNACNEGEHVKGVHKKNGKYKRLCPICGKEIYHHGYNAHLRAHELQDENIEKKFKCSKCYFSFYSEERLEKHMKYHSLEKIYPCNICGLKFKGQCLVTRHIKLIHERYEASECSICHKVLKCKNTLKRHMTTHTKEIQYECDTCNKKFFSKLGLICHFRSHTGERPYKCNYCNSTFAVHKTLVEHVRLHTGEKPFRCPVCDKGFAQKGNMRSHFRYNHKDSTLKP